MGRGSRRGVRARKRIGSWIAVAVALLLTTAGCSDSKEAGNEETEGPTAVPASSDEPIHVRGATFVTSASSAPATLLTADPDIARQVGVDIDWKIVNGAQNSLVALIAGEVDFAYVTVEAMLGAVASGEDLVAITHGGGIATELVLSNDFIEKTGVSPDDPIEDRFNALKGATIASSAVGTSHPSALQARMNSLKLGRYEDLVQPVTLIDTVALVEGIRQGQFDGAAWSAGALRSVVDDGTASVWISVANDDLPEAAERPAIVWAARRSWVEENLEAAKRLHEAFEQSVQYLKTQTEAASEVLKPIIFPEMPQDQWDYVVKAILPVFHEDGAVSKDAWDATVEALTASLTEVDLSDVDMDSLVHPLMRGDGW